MLRQQQALKSPELTTKGFPYSHGGSSICSYAIWNAWLWGCWSRGKTDGEEHSARKRHVSLPFPFYWAELDRWSILELNLSHFPGLCSWIWVKETSHLPGLLGTLTIYNGRETRCANIALSWARAAPEEGKEHSGAGAQHRGLCLQLPEAPGHVNTIRTSQHVERSLQDTTTLRKRENYKKYNAIGVIMLTDPAFIHIDKLELCAHRGEYI